MKVESAISILPNALGGGLITWLIFRGVEPIPLWGAGGVAFDIAATTFLLTLLSTLVVTLVIRKRIRTEAAKRETPGRFALPNNLIVRGISLAFFTTLIFAPLAIAIINAIWGKGWGANDIILFKILYCVLLGLAVTPIAVLSALRDR